MKSSYQNLDRGDIIFVNLNPTRDHEPCMVLSKQNRYLDSMIGVAPITSKSKPFPLHVPLPENSRIRGEVLLEHHRMIDVAERGFQYVETASKEVVSECLAKIKLLYV